MAKKPVLYTILCLTQSNSNHLNDPPEGYFQKTRRTYRIEKPINTTGNDKVHLKCDCNNGSIVSSDREPSLYSFAFDKPRGHKVRKEPRIKQLKKIKKSVLSHIIVLFIQKMMITNRLVLIEKGYALLAKELKFKKLIDK